MLNSTVIVTVDSVRGMAQTLISMCVRDVSLTRGMTRNGRVMSFVVRYLWVRGHVEVNVTCPVTQDDITHYFISSNSPSGGMKLMLRSVSNLLSLTHWWNVQSSMAMLVRVLLPPLCGVCMCVRVVGVGEVWMWVRCVGVWKCW